ncbi:MULTISPECIES: SixA phosphatase family protein [Rhodococcus]|uniref:Histidine phosphatase family protein n=1 Tax=Rhodococcus qingshengii JCM 15477 TaxID=1303681 RepID=A0AB38RIG6_RHOSG|nr:MULTISPECIES: histidine phosphatase family protein [Rhodococcus]UPU44731.1 histidine phosphatase family protein [Rhodococcus qingshengii JCM 15477]
MADHRTLVLMRHGKSSYPEGIRDHERQLAERGLREARIGGEWIRENVPPVDAVLCSTSRRTVETLASTGIEAPAGFEKSIYGGSPADVIAAARTTSDHVKTLLIVGHEPGIPWTALDLASNENSEAAQRIRDKFPTSAIAVLSVPVPWTELDDSVATLLEFHVPR